MGRKYYLDPQSGEKIYIRDKVPSLKNYRTSNDQDIIDNQIKKSIDEKITAPNIASVGQTIRVKIADESGKPTEWEAVDMPSGGGKTAYQYAQDGGYTGTEEEFAEKMAKEQLTGTTDELTPAQVCDAVLAGIPVKVQYTDSTYGLLSFTAFNVAESLNTIVSQTIVYYNGVYILAELWGDTVANNWGFNSTTLAQKTDIPTALPSPKTIYDIDLTNAVFSNLNDIGMAGSMALLDSVMGARELMEAVNANDHAFSVRYTGNIQYRNSSGYSYPATSPCVINHDMPVGAGTANACTLLNGIMDGGRLKFPTILFFSDGTEESIGFTVTYV